MRTVVAVILFSLYPTIGFAQPVQFQWARTWSDRPTIKVVVDSLGYIYATGTVSVSPTSPRMFVRKYSPSGNVVWTSVHPEIGDGRDLLLDSQRNVYVTGQERSQPSNRHLIVVKYNNDGVQQWLYRTQGSRAAGENTGVKLALSADESSVYVAGSVEDVNDARNLITVKLSSQGTLRWASQHFKWEDDWAVDIQVRPVTSQINRVCILGRSDPRGSGPRAFLTIVYRDEGNTAVGLDTIVYNSGNQSNDVPVGLIMDDNLNFYVAGYTSTGGSGDMMRLFKYNGNGDTIWTRQYPATNFHWVEYGTTTQVCKDKHNNLILGTSTYAQSQLDLQIIKYDSDGTLRWARTYARPNLDYVGNICLDDSNSIYATVENLGNSHLGLYKYDENGNFRWTQTYGSVARGTSIAVDKNRNVYVGGSGNLLVKYSQGNRSLKILQRENLNLAIPDLGTVEDTIRVIDDSPEFAISDVNVVIDSLVHPRVSDLELYLIHNEITDTLIYQVGGTGANFINTVLDDSATTLIANGTAPFTGNFRPSRPLSIFNSADHSGDWVLRVYDRLTGNTGVLKAWKLQLQYLRSVTEVTPMNEVLPSGFSLSQNFPNPFNPSTTIRFSVPDVNDVTLEVFDLLGRRVATLVNRVLPRGSYEATFNAAGLSSGVYIYRLTGGGHSLARKLLLSK